MRFPPFRVALLLVLISCFNMFWLLENPANSAILLHPWLQWAIKTIQSASGRATQTDGSVLYFCYSLGVGPLVTWFHDQKLCQQRYTKWYFGCATLNHHLWSKQWSWPTTRCFGSWTKGQSPRNWRRVYNQRQNGIAMQLVESVLLAPAA